MLGRCRRRQADRGGTRALSACGGGAGFRPRLRKVTRQLCLTARWSMPGWSAPTPGARSPALGRRRLEHGRIAGGQAGERRPGAEGAGGGALLRLATDPANGIERVLDTAGAARAMGASQEPAFVLGAGRGTGTAKWAGPETHCWPRRTAPAPTVICPTTADARACWWPGRALPMARTLATLICGALPPTGRADGGAAEGCAGSGARPALNALSIAAEDRLDRQWRTQVGNAERPAARGRICRSRIDRLARHPSRSAKVPGSSRVRRAAPWRRLVTVPRCGACPAERGKTTAG